MFFPVMVIVNRFYFQRSLFLLLFRFVFLNLVCYFSSFSFLCVAIFLLYFSFVHRGFSLFFFFVPHFPFFLLCRLGMALYYSVFFLWLLLLLVLILLVSGRTGARLIQPQW